MENSTPALSSKRRELRKNQAIVVIVIGPILFAQASLISAEVGSPSICLRTLLP